MRSAKTNGNNGRRRRGAARAQLLDAACKAFAERGFHDATVADICEQAGTNVAAVNYYFGDKERLYVEAWRLAFRRSLEAHPPDGGTAADAPAEERLRARIRSLVRRVMDPEARDFEIARQELAHPTGLLDEVRRKSIEPMQRSLAAVVRELLGPKAPERQVRFCQMSILAQCLHPLLRERQRRPKPSGLRGSPWAGEIDVEDFADHIFRFSLAGIREARRSIERGNRGVRA